MKFKIYQNDKLINTIVSDEKFCKNYCDRNGYTYEEIIEESISEPEYEPTTEEILDTLLGVTVYE